MSSMKLGAVEAMLGTRDKSVMLMDKQIVLYPQNSNSSSVKAKVEIEKNYNGAALNAGMSFKGDSLVGALLREFAGEFSIKVEKEEEIKDARITLDEFHKFVSEFVAFTEKALDMYPEMAKREDLEEMACGGPDKAGSSYGNE